MSIILKYHCGRLNSLKILLDRANGASSALAPQLFKEIEIEVISVFAKPDSEIINEQCGSTHLEALVVEVVKHSAKLGFTFDGDYIMFIVGSYLNEKGQLNKGTVMSTVMSNLGFHGYSASAS